MALRAQSIRAAAAMLLLFAAAAIASTTAAPIQLRSCSVPPLNGSLPTWPNPTKCGLLNALSDELSAQFFARRTLHFDVVPPSDSGMAFWNYLEDDNNGTDSPPPYAAGAFASWSSVPTEAPPPPPPPQNSSDVAASPPLPLFSRDTLAWRLYAERGSNDGITGPSISMAAFDDADDYDFEYNSTGFVTGNLGGGGQWETMQTLSFQSVFEFVDRDRNGHYTPGVDTIVSRVDLRSLVWDRPCSSNLSSFPGAGAPGDRYATWNLASLPIDDDVAQGLRVVLLLESGSGAAGVLGPSDDLSAGAQVLLLGARNVRFVLSLQDYAFTRNDTLLALNATLLHVRRAHDDSAIRPSNLDLTGASGVGGSSLPRPIRLSDVNVLSSAGVVDPHTHAPARFDEAYVAWNPSWTTLLPRNDDDDDAAFQTSNVTDRLWTNVTLSQLIALQPGDATSAMGPDAAGMFFGNYTTRDANGSAASSAAVQHAKVAATSFILSFASGPKSASAVAASSLRRSLNVSFSLGVGPVPLPGTAQPAPAPPKSKVVWILVGAAGGVLLFLTVVWIFCRTKKKQHHSDVAAHNNSGHHARVAIPADDLEHSDQHYQTLVNEEYEGVAAGGMNAHAYSPFSPPSAVSSTSGGLSGGEEQSIPSAFAAALSPSHHRHVRSPSSGGTVGSPRRVAGKSLSFSSATERERRAEALMIRGGAGPANSVGQLWGGAVVLSSASAASRHSSPSPVSNVPPPQSLAREQPAAPTHLL